MDSQSFPIYLNQKVKFFNLRFANPYHLKLFKKQVKELGYILQEVLPSEEKKANGEPKWFPSEIMLEKASRAQLFQKVMFICPFESDMWQKLKKAKLSSPCIMYTDNAQAKSAELWEGPSNQEIIDITKTKLQELGYQFDPDAWKILLEHNSEKGVVEDPEGLWNCAYSIAIQSEGMVDSGLVISCLGRKGNSFDLLDLLLDKDIRKSLQCMHILVNDKEVIGLCSGLQTMLCDHLGAYEAWEKKETPDGYAAKVGLHPFRAKKMFEKAKRVPKINFLRLRDALLSADLMMKSNRQTSNSEIFKNQMMMYLNL